MHTITPLLPVTAYLLVVTAVLLAKRTVPLPLNLAALTAATAAHIALGWRLGLATAAAAVILSAVLTTITPRYLSPVGALTIVGTCATAPFTAWWIPPAAWLLASAVALVALRRAAGSDAISSLVLNDALPALGIGPEQLSGAKLLPSKPSLSGVNERAAGIALTGTRLYLPPYLLAAALGAIALNAVG